MAYICGTSGVHYVTSQPFLLFGGEEQTNMAAPRAAPNRSKEILLLHGTTTWSLQMEIFALSVLRVQSFNSWLCLEAPLKYCGQHAQFIQINWLEMRQLTCNCFCCDLNN